MTKLFRARSLDQIKDLRRGQLMSMVWPKLGEKEQDHWLGLAKQIEFPEQSNDNGGS